MTTKDIEQEHRTEDKPLLYLACPYSHDRDLVVERRVAAVNNVSARLMEKKINVFSPITHSHAVQKMSFDVPNTWEFWEKVDKEYLDVSYALLVCCLNGWDESTGVTAEIQYKDPVYYLDPIEMEVSETGYPGTHAKDVILSHTST